MFNDIIGFTIVTVIEVSSKVVAIHSITYVPQFLAIASHKEDLNGEKWAS